MNIKVVIGANYGDEGKGLIAEFLCKNSKAPVVVLSNGGCQRGHTVNNVEKGIRHVFHHFGSGTIVGAPTLFSSTYLLNPIAYVKEYEELVHLGITPECARSPRCILQLPSDMFINQTIEKARAASMKQHGSCGWGIWETQVRVRDYAKLEFEDFSKMSFEEKKSYMLDALHWQLDKRICDIYKPFVDLFVISILESDQFICHFIQDFEKMQATCGCLETSDLVKVAKDTEHETIIVENAQGLLLDKKHAPKDDDGRTDIHATPSDTTLKGALASLGNNNIDADDVVAAYVSRTYMTRHGAGPFPEHTPGMTFNDMTNVHNEYQGSMRFGKISYDAANALLRRIANDAHSCGCTPSLALTHVNEMRCSLLEENARWKSYEDDSSKVI